MRIENGELISGTYTTSSPKPYIYLDNAATGLPKSEGVFNAMRDSFFNCGNGGRSGHAYSIAAAEAVFACRENLAALFGSVCENVVLCSGATYALNIAVKGLLLSSSSLLSPPSCLTSAMEHNSVLRPLYALEDSGKIKLNFFTPSFESAQNTLENALSALTPDTKMLVITHASNACGMTLPVEEICREARKKDIITVIDCAQTAGHIPIDIKRLDADVICIAGHKGLYGPMGTGALIINPESRLNFSTIIEGGAGTSSREKFMPLSLPERLEPGTVNITGIAGLSAAAAESAPDIAREEALRQRVIEGLKAINGIRLYGVDCDCLYMPVVLFNVEGVPSETAAERLAQRGICVRAGLHCAPLAHEALGTGPYGAVRVSLGRGNSEADCDALIEAMNN